MHTLVAIVGPTASGKTALGEALALQFNGEIISADSKQVYRGMDIGTAKELHLRVPQHLIDIKNPGEKITAAEYQALAYETIDDVIKRGKQPFLVGGSMLYVDAVLEGYTFQGKGHKEGKPRYRALRIGLEWDREKLREKAVSRIQARLEAGMEAEVQSLLDNGVSPEWLWQCGIEYRFMSAFLTGQMTREEAIQKIEIATSQYIKRQYTWWRHHGQVLWLPEAASATPVVEAFLSGQDVVY
jgi:tRNA dimethylallyltransferase